MSVSNPTSKPIPLLCGPTASGKTGIAVRLFGDGATAVSADCVQIYRYMDIGSAKPGKEDLGILPHRLLDIRTPDETYSAGHFFRDAENELDAIIAGQRQPLVVGGTGLYLKTLTNGFFAGPPADPQIREALANEEADAPGRLYQELKRIDPETAGTLFPNDQRRIIRALEVYRITGISISTLREKETLSCRHTFRIAGIIHDRAVLAKRIADRVGMMMENGLIEETRDLLAAGYSRDLPSMQSLGYRHACEHILDDIPLEETIHSIIRDTKAFARRQILLFKKIPGLVWFNGMDMDGLRHYFCL